LQPRSVRRMGGGGGGPAFHFQSTYCIAKYGNLTSNLRKEKKLAQKLGQFNKAEDSTILKGNEGYAIIEGKKRKMMKKETILKKIALRMKRLVAT